MAYQRDTHDRRSIRLPGYDYRAFGAYFVTICTADRDPLFGQVTGGRMEGNVLAGIVERVWSRTMNHGAPVEPYEFVVMPNHVHGIVWLPGTARDRLNPNDVGARRPPCLDDIADQTVVPSPTRQADRVDASPLQRDGDARGLRGAESRSLGSMTGSFKSQTARAINGMRGTPGLQTWQRNYYERIIRGQRELAAVRQYILDNPLKWLDDPNHRAA